MVRILYGISGEGIGHATRSKAIIEHLQKKHEVLIITYGKCYSMLKDKFKVHEIYGLRFSFRDNRISKTFTFTDNFLRFLKEAPSTCITIHSLIREFKPDLIISDFEPVSSWASVFYGIPLISIDNQHLFTNCDVECPPKYKSDFLLTKFIVKNYLARSDYDMITCFYHPRVLEKKKDKTVLIPPILRNEVLRLKSKKGEYVFVYQTGNGDERSLEVLKEVNEKFVIYGFGREEKIKNLQLKKFSESGLLKDLANSKFVITTSGLSLMSEALHLRKPMLTIPVQGQFEQIANAHYLKKAGYGDYSEKLSKKSIEQFSKNLKRYEHALKNYPKEDNSKTFDELDKLVEKIKLLSA